jgi:hypothetical protein
VVDTIRDRYYLLENLGTTGRTNVTALQAAVTLMKSIVRGCPYFAATLRNPQAVISNGTSRCTTAHQDDKTLALRATRQRNGAVMSDQIEELIREIAAKHGIAVSRDDPILVLQTINNRLLLDSSTAQQAQLEHYKSEIEALSTRWQIDAKSKADRTLNAALAAGHSAIQNILEMNAEKFSLRVSEELEGASAKIENAVENARRVAFQNLIASLITLGAGIVVTFGIFFH